MQFEIPKNLISPIEQDGLKIADRAFRIAADCSAAGCFRSTDGQNVYCSPRSRMDNQIGVMPLRLDPYEQWGQECADLTFVPVAGEAVGSGEQINKIPFGLVSVVKLKRNGSATGGLDSFESWFFRLSATTGRHPLTWVWWPFFERKTRETEDGGFAWHRLHWQVEEVFDNRQYKIMQMLSDHIVEDPKFLKIAGRLDNQRLLPASQEWFIEGRQDPVSLKELVAIASPTTLVWRDGLAGWTPAAEIQELAQTM